MRERESWMLYFILKNIRVIGGSYAFSGPDIPTAGRNSSDIHPETMGVTT